MILSEIFRQSQNQNTRLYLVHKKLQEFTFPLKHKIKEGETLHKYQDLTRELKELIPVIARANETNLKNLEK